MLVVGLTGGIGCGKSIVADIFYRDFNIPIIDADAIAQELSKKDYVRELIFEKIGSEYLDENRDLQREKLRQAIFADPVLRDKLEAILHPIVYKEIDQKLEMIDADYCIVVIPLLLETKHSSFVNRVLVVDCTIENQIQRVMQRDQCSESHVRSIIATQISREERLRLADDVIENHDSIDSLNEKVALLHQKYSALSNKPNIVRQNSIDPNFITYEQPLNERMRTFLRYEQLTCRFGYFAKREDTSDSHTALMTLIEILSLVSRGDIKQELLKEIKRQMDNLEGLADKPKLDTTMLSDILASHKSIFDRLHTARGQLGSHLKNNDFISSIRQRAVIPGGTCDFDLPEYHYWLAQPFVNRNKILMDWIAPFDIVQEGATQVLQLIRESTPYSTKHAPRGFYDQNLDPSQPNQLIRIGIKSDLQLFPECSAGKHRFSIRFLEQADPNSKPKQRTSDIEFKLACCTF